MHLTQPGVPESQQHPTHSLPFIFLIKSVLQRTNHSLQACNCTSINQAFQSSQVPRAMASKTPTWADQWDNLDGHDGDDKNKKTSDSSSGKKMAEAKAAASAGFDKATVAATAGTQKVKSGTSAGMKWVRNQYQKFSSK